MHVVVSLEAGGMENGLVNVARGLKPEEFQISVCCLERGGLFAKRLGRSNRVRVLGKPPGFSWRTVFALAHEIAHVKPHVLHTHNLGPLTYGSLASVGGRWHPILHGEHGLLPTDQLQPRRLRQRAWLYHCCQLVHTVSHGLTQQLRDLGLPASRIVTLSNGVDTERFVPGSRQAARNRIGHFPDDALVVGIVGRFVPLKRHADLIGAFNLIARQQPNLHLLIVGGGGTEGRQIETQVAASGAAARIHLAGFQDQLPSFYQAMDLLVVPSIYEGMSNVVLEAMACGIPVLAHDVCGNAEMICHQQDGIIADLSTVERLQAALASLIARPEQLAQLGLKAREKTARHFSLAQMVARYEKLYRQLSKTDGN